MSDIFLIKFGGNILSGPEGIRRLAGEIADLQRAGKKVIVVHGGGPAISEEMKNRGLSPVMVGGQRVTDESALLCVEDVLSSINRTFVQALSDAGAAALGIGAFTFLVSRKRPPYRVLTDGKEETVDLGLVGCIESVDPAVLLGLLDEGTLPVVYPVGTDGERHLNINADTTAASIAVAVGAREMIAVTDVPGILRDVRDPSSKIDKIAIPEIDRLMKDGTVSGGMIPKVEACAEAVRAGVSAVRMVDGRAHGKTITEAINGVSHGTLIVRERRD